MTHASGIYEGWVRHRRFRPYPHAFRYPLFLLYLDLAEIPSLLQTSPYWGFERFAPASFFRKDFLGDVQRSLESEVRRFAQEKTGRPAEGPIRLLTHVRYFGYIFNPVHFYYCFDRSGKFLETLILEVMNTPWHERYRYVLACEDSSARGGPLRFRVPKGFHVSPFLGMAMEYVLHFLPPKDRLVIHMDCREEAGTTLDATLSLKRRDLSNANLRHVLWKYPVLTAKVTAAIYWEALKLWWKRVPYYPHPGVDAQRPASRPLADLAGKGDSCTLSS